MFILKFIKTKNDIATVLARGARVAGVIIAATFAGSGQALAATGDNLASFDAAATAGIPACNSGVGTGIAYDGTSLILSCWSSNVLERVDAVSHLNNGQVIISGLPNGDDLGAMAWDEGRKRLWACNGQNTVVLIDVGAAAVDLSVTPFTVPACVDGLAYDASDDTLWVSPDVSTTAYHYDLSGNQIAAFPVALGNCGNSGIAVGGPKLYLANNGCSEIYEVAKDFSSSTLFASFPARLEDLECDGKTFGPTKGAIWSQDAYDRILNAWEIPPGACEFGGGVEGPFDSPSCSDGRDNDGDGLIDADDPDCKSPNDPPVCTLASAGPDTLWPPNHKMKSILITGVTDPNGDPVTITTTGISQDELVAGDGQGSGNTSPDGALNPLSVRAERNGNPKTPGDGRVYHIGFTASDGKLSCEGTVRVCVPHDMRPNGSCVDGGPLYDSLTP